MSSLVRREVVGKYAFELHYDHDCGIFYDELFSESEGINFKSNHRNYNNMGDCSIDTSDIIDLHNYAKSEGVAKGKGADLKTDALKVACDDIELKDIEDYIENDCDGELIEGDPVTVKNYLDKYREEVEEYILEMLARDGFNLNVFDIDVVPIYAYIHGSVALSTGPFGCRFDSGVFGFLTVDSDSGVDLEARAPNFIKEMNALIEGEIYGFILKEYESEEAAKEDFGGDETSSCWGFYGYESEEEMIDEMLGVVEAPIEILRELKKRLGASEQSAA